MLTLIIVHVVVLILFLFFFANPEFVTEIGKLHLVSLSVLDYIIDFFFLTNDQKRGGKMTRLLICYSLRAMDPRCNRCIKCCFFSPPCDHSPRLGRTLKKQLTLKRTDIVTK